MPDASITTKAHPAHLTDCKSASGNVALIEDVVRRMGASVKGT